MSLQCMCVCMHACIRTRSSIFKDDFQNNLAHFVFRSKIVICKFHSHRLKVKVTWVRQAVARQPSSSTVVSKVVFLWTV